MIDQQNARPQDDQQEKVAGFHLMFRSPFDVCVWDWPQPVGQSRHLTTQETLMKPHRISVFLALLSVVWLGVAPAWGVSKEMVQLQTQVQQLQEQMTAMQRSFD